MFQVGRQRGLAVVAVIGTVCMCGGSWVCGVGVISVHWCVHACACWHARHAWCACACICAVVSTVCVCVCVCIGRVCIVANMESC